MKIEKGIDNILVITLPSIELVTYAKDLDDVGTAIGEACLTHQLLKYKHSLA